MTVFVNKSIVIVGGGAAGFFAALRAAEAPGIRVVILEQSMDVLKKVRISGGGRCNVTHHCFDVRELVKRYPRGDKELLGPFHRWGPPDTVEWFRERGVYLKTEEDGRMFPVTDSSQTIVDCLRTTAERRGVKVLTNVTVQRIEEREEGFLIRDSKGGEYHADRLLIAAGGLKPGALVEALVKLGHTIEPLAPSLFTFHLKPNVLKGLPGISLENVALKLPEHGLSERGPLLVTHTGLSGPAVLKLSAWGARKLQACGYTFRLEVNWLGGARLDVAEQRLTAFARGSGRKKLLRNLPLGNIPLRLWVRLLELGRVPDECRWGQLQGAFLRQLAESLCQTTLSVSGKTMNKEEFVTCGGVRLSEINFKTMESRIARRLYFAGEVLDIDGVTGGFNFQAAWTTGYLAGTAMVELGA